MRSSGVASAAPDSRPPCGGDGSGGRPDGFAGPWAGPGRSSHARNTGVTVRKPRRFMLPWRRRTVCSPLRYPVTSVDGVRYLCDSRTETTEEGEPSASRHSACPVSQLAEYRRQHVADHRRHVRRPDEPPRPGRALRVDRPEEVGGQRAGHDVRRVLAGAHRLGAVDLQDGLRRHLAREVASHNGGARPSCTGVGRCSSTSSTTSSANRDGSPTASANRARRCRRPTPSSPSTSRLVAGLLPVRLRGHHPAAVPRAACWPDQVQCLVHPGAAVVDLRLRRRRLHALGRRLLRPGGCARLLRWLRHPHVGRGLGLRGRLGPRASAPARSTARLAQQPGDGGGRCRHPVAGLERLQRW